MNNHGEDPFGGEIQRLHAEATLLTAVAAFDPELHLPPWFNEVNQRHRAFLAQLEEAGDSRAQVFRDHLPCFDDGVSCSGGISVYPCGALRAVHDGEGIWDGLVALYPADWVLQATEWDECGPEPA